MLLVSKIGRGEQTNTEFFSRGNIQTVTKEIANNCIFIHVQKRAGKRKILFYLPILPIFPFQGSCLESAVPLLQIPTHSPDIQVSSQTSGSTRLNRN